ncbi:sulfurtransferase [uncultured Meiothermus sp.]|jgi:thiosulfate/3-mercaptopyruvate sulfurtransferase|uniref:sulfurtransferase n=1 Tax=uncultured Meiothermus sp. TaxID=157471 RepID=UPI002612B6F6|nr:sulfurtransferase [uncultured Meiothermus sp.]
MSSPLVSVEGLHQRLGDSQLRIVDCRFSLQDPLAGRLAFRHGHIPGAIFLDLEADLSAPKRQGGQGGRHPLPEPEDLAKKLGAAGIGNEHWVVAYDEPPAGGMFAPRLWWLLRWLGHDRIAVLDGGIKAWREAGYEVSTLAVEYASTTFKAKPRLQMVVDADAVAHCPAGTILIDSRAPERYRGEVEPIDPVAGHIPGAINRNWLDSLDASGHFKKAEAQAERFAGLEGEVIAYCGSGVSATANVLALELAGKQARLYAGSWSDWVSVKSRPVAKGAE